MFELLMGGNPNGNQPFGQQLFKTATDWTVPTGVTSISAVCVGSGGGNASNNTIAGSGGDLRWRNHIPVTPGEVLSVLVGLATAGKVGVTTKITRKATGEVLLIAKGGDNTDVSSAINGSDIGGGNGGKGSQVYGGGAGGYSGNGGTARGAGDADSGAGGSGSSYTYNTNGFGCGGGGVGLNGKGATGAAAPNNTGTQAYGGYAGSGGINGDHTSGGNYGGGSGAPVKITSTCIGGNGGCRIIWGSGRAFPATKTADIAA